MSAIMNLDNLPPLIHPAAHETYPISDAMLGRRARKYTPGLRYRRWVLVSRFVGTMAQRIRFMQMAMKRYKSPSRIMSVAEQLELCRIRDKAHNLNLELEAWADANSTTREEFDRIMDERAPYFLTRFLVETGT